MDSLGSCSLDFGGETESHVDPRSAPFIPRLLGMEALMGVCVCAMGNPPLWQTQGVLNGDGFRETAL